MIGKKDSGGLERDERMKAKGSFESECPMAQ